MASLWWDHFGDYYDAADMLQGCWAEVDNTNFGAGAGWVISTANPPRAGASHMRCVGGLNRMRRALGAAKTTAGLATRDYFNILPLTEPETDHSNISGILLREWRNGVNNTQLTVVLGTDGAIAVYTGRPGSVDWGTYRLARSAQCIYPKNYHHIEDKITVNASTGTYELRVDGVTRINLTGINTDPLGTGDVSQIVRSHYSTGGAPPGCTWDFADIHCWDSLAGQGLTDFGGNLAVLADPLTQDTADAGWSLSTGAAGYPLLNDKNAATYIEADSTTLKSGFKGAGVPTGTSGIVGVQVKFRGLKTDGGDCNVAPSVKSGSSETAVTGQPMTMGEAWRWGIFGSDPATSAPFTRTGYNAAGKCVTRTL